MGDKIPTHIRRITLDDATFENTNASINELYIYGNHLNLKGTLDIDFDITELNLILFGNKEMNYKLNFENIENGINFYISDKKNNGILLDNLEKNSYIAFLKVTDINGNNTYYKLKNNTNYPETEYYTIRKNNNINYILIKEDRENTLNINVMNKKDNIDDIYDVVIDAGHGRYLHRRVRRHQTGDRNGARHGHQLRLQR